MRNLIIISLLVITSSLHAQNFSWVKPIGGPAEDEILAVCSDKEGNVIITGRYRNTINLSDDYSLKVFPGHNECFIAKYSPEGSFIWGLEFGGEGDDEGVYASTDDLGNVYVIANSQSKILKYQGFDLSGKQSNKVVLLKINSSGRLEWAQKIVEGNSLTQAISVAGTSAGYVCISGQYGAGTIKIGAKSFTNMGNMDIIYAMFNAKDGKLLWAQTAGQKGNDFAEKVAIDQEGNMLLTGRSIGQFGDDIYIGNQTISLHVNYTSFIARIDVNGNILWVKRLFGQNGIYTDGLAYTSDGSIYLSGFVAAGRHTLIDTVYTTYAKGNQFVLKLNGKGERIWGQTFACSQLGRILNLTTDASDNCIIGGWLRGDAQFDLSNLLYPDPNVSRVFAVRIDPSGNVEGAWQAGNNVNSSAGSVVAAGKGNHLYLAGYYNGETIQLGRHELIGKGATDSYIACLAAENASLVAIQEDPSDQNKTLIIEATPARVALQELAPKPTPKPVELVPQQPAAEKKVIEKPIEKPLAEKKETPKPAEKPLPAKAETPKQASQAQTPKADPPATPVIQAKQQTAIQEKPVEEKKPEPAVAKKAVEQKKPEQNMPQKPAPEKKAEPPMEEKLTSPLELVTPNPTTGIITINLPANTSMVVILDANNSYIFHDFTHRKTATTLKLDLSQFSGQFNVVVKTRDNEVYSKEITIKQ